jgi:hypothetical protein
MPLVTADPGPPVASPAEADSYAVADPAVHAPGGRILGLRQPPLNARLSRYRRGEQTDAMGKLILGPMCSGGSGGVGDEEHTHKNTRFTQVRV